MNKRLRSYVTSAHKGEAITGMLIGWLIGRNISPSWGILTIVVLCFVYSLLVHSYFSKDRNWEDWFGEFTVNISNSQGESE